MNTYEHYKKIAVTRDNLIATVTLNSPETLNAIDGDLHYELSTIFFDLANDTNVNVIILTGAGRAFCGGGDLRWVQQEIDKSHSYVESLKQGRNIVMGIIECPKPIICRLNGDAVGVGATIALLSDMIIAVDSARITDPHVRIGLVAGDGGALIWPQLIGFAKAKEFLLTGNGIKAPDAAQLGLINYSVKAEDLDATVSKFSTQMATASQAALRFTKLCINIPLRQMASSVLESSLAYEAITMLQNEDLREGISAFLEKRPAKFKGT